MAGQSVDALERVDRLTSELISGEITESQMQELQTLLEEDADARRCYLDTMRLHTDLVEHYGNRTKPAVLGTLASEGLPDAAACFAAAVPFVEAPLGSESLGRAAAGG